MLAQPQGAAGVWRSMVKSLRSDPSRLVPCCCRERCGFESGAACWSLGSARKSSSSSERTSRDVERFLLVRVQQSGPLMVQGAGSHRTPPTAPRWTPDRFMVAICTCRRSKIFPLCDTSHRRKIRAAAEAKSDRHPSAS